MKKGREEGKKKEKEKTAKHVSMYIDRLHEIG